MVKGEIRQQSNSLFAVTKRFFGEIKDKQVRKKL